MTEKEKARKRCRAKERRDEAKRNGLCVFCFKVPPLIHRVKCEDCRKYLKASMQRTKLAAFNMYGGPFCACCGEREIGFLTIDHVNNDGAKNRKVHGTGNAMYRWLKKNGYPSGFQVLCFNCNSGRACNGGICPHKKGNTNDSEPRTY